MSWSMFEDIYPGNTSLAAMQADIEESGYNNRGAAEPITQKLKDLTPIYGVQKDYSAAVEVVRDYTSRNHGASACIKYMRKSCSEEKMGKKALELREKVGVEGAKLKKYTEDHSVLKQKAAYIGCSCCGSKINKSFLKDSKKRVTVVYKLHDSERSGYYAEASYNIQECPVCEAPLNSSTVMDSIAKRIEKINATLNEYREFVMRNAKEEEKWYVYGQTYLG